MTLSYRNESDRCYGATGMAIGLVVFDGEEMLSAMSLDSPAHSIMEMDQDFFFAGNPSLSAKAAWSRMVKNFNLMTAMMLGNVMCRSMVLDKKEIEPDMRRQLHDRIVEEGAASCSLEEDEAERLFEKDFDYLYRVFSHDGVQSIAHDFARTLSQVRRMSRHEMLEQLRGLAML